MTPEEMRASSLEWYDRYNSTASVVWAAAAELAERLDEIIALLAMIGRRR